MERTPKTVTRVQTGIRLERSILKVLKAIATDKDMKLGDLLEGILLHAYEGKQVFTNETLATVADAKRLYGCDLSADDSHWLSEQ